MNGEAAQMRMYKQEQRRQHINDKLMNKLYDNNINTNKYANKEQ